MVNGHFLIAKQNGFRQMQLIIVNKKSRLHAAFFIIVFLQKLISKL